MHSNSTVPLQSWLGPRSSQLFPLNDPFNYTLTSFSSNEYIKMQYSSMINKLPGRRNVNLSAHPEIVIFFQAAEIQRLSNCVSSSRMVSKGQTKEHLDRHSYQVQIKQLVDLLERIKVENQQLQERNRQMQVNFVVFQESIRKQQQGRQEQTDFSKLNDKYNRALKEIGRLYDDNVKLQQENNQTLIQLAQVKEQTKTTLSTFQNLGQKDMNVQRAVQQATKQLRLYIAEMESKSAENILEMRKNFQQEIQQYKSRVHQRDQINQKESFEQIQKFKKKLQETRQQLNTIHQQNFQLTNNLRKYEQKLKQSELKLNKKQFQCEKSNQQLFLLSTKLQNLQIQASAHFGNNSNSLSLNTVNSSIQKQTSDHLQNKIAMLSQQLERLSQILRQKKQQVSRLQNTIESKTRKHQIQLMEIRVRYEAELRKQSQRADIQVQAAKQQAQKYYKQMMKQAANYSENNGRMQYEFVKIREEERKVCEAVYEKKLQSLQTSYQKDKVETDRLKNQINRLNNQIDQLRQNSINISSEQRASQVKYLQNLQKIEKQYNHKILQLQQKNAFKSRQKQNQLIQNCKEQIKRLQKKLQQQAELIRDTEIEHIQQMNNMQNSYENNLQNKQREKQALQKIIKEKQRQIDQMRNLIQVQSSQKSQLSQKKYELFMKKIDYLISENVTTKNTIIQTIASSKTNSSPHFIDDILSSLQYLSNQITTLSKQVLDSNFQFIQANTNSNGNLYSEQYVKQLQSECDNYLKIINSQMSGQQSLKIIWEQIQKNNRFNRQQNQKLRENYEKQQRVIQNFQEQRTKWEEIRFQNQKIKYECLKIQEDIDNRSHFDLEQQQKTKKRLIQSHERDLKHCNDRVEQLYKQLDYKEALIQDYQVKLSVLGQQQNREISNLTSIIQKKSLQLAQLSENVSEYKNKYIQTKQKIKSVQVFIEKVAKQEEFYLRNQQKLQIENKQYRKQLSIMQQQLIAQKQQKQTLLQKSKSKLKKISKKLIQQSDMQYAVQNNHDQNVDKMRGLQKQFHRLENIVDYLKKDNYLLKRQNYDGSTQDHVFRQFTTNKVRELNKQIERLMSENIDLKDQISRCRLELVEEFNAQRRNQQNLGLFTLLAIEIEALRSRLK